MSKKTLSIILSLIVLSVMSAFVFDKIGLFTKIFHTPLPSAVPFNEFSTSTPIPKPTTSMVALIKEGVNLNVPFTSQAPHKNWNDPYQDFCEEASALMAMSYIRGENISNPDVADAKMLAIKSFEETRFGYHKDTNVAETAIIIKEFYKYLNVVVLKNPSIYNIKKVLSEGKAVIVPLAGREMGNPYYNQPGPLYHMLVIKGYTKDGKFITNDPGTRRGADFIYSPEVLFNAIHDWNGGDVNNGAKVIIVVG